MEQKLLILEDSQDRIRSMQKHLQRNGINLSVEFFRDSTLCIDWLKDNLAEIKLISLDHDLDPESNQSSDPGCGRDVVNFLVEQTSIPPVIVHSANYTAAIGMEMALIDASFTVERVTPFIAGLKWIRKEWLPVVKKFLIKDQQSKDKKT